MNSDTTRSLLWMAVILLIVGGMIVSPQGSMLVLSFAVLCALPSLLVGSRRRRVAAVVVVAIAAAMAASAFSGATREGDRYRERTTRSHR